MAEESFMSGASTLDQPPVPGAGAGGAQAEMITKKLANYWIIIGSIPMVLFLLVAIPTIFYVKNVSEYKNAYYCDTVSCATLATEIEKAYGSKTKACDNFELHICPQTKDLEMDVYTYAVKTVTKGDAETLQGISKAVRIAFDNCRENQGIAAAMEGLEKEFGFTDFLNANFKKTPGEAAGLASKWGVDTLIRCLQVPVSTGTTQLDITLQIGAPIVDRYVELLADYVDQPKERGHIYTTLLKKSMEEAGTGLTDKIFEDPSYFPKIDKFHVAFQDYVTSTTTTLKGNLPEISNVEDLELLSRPEWDWKTFLATVIPTLQPSTMIRIAHPMFIRGLASFLTNITAKLQPLVDIANPASMKVALDTLLHTYGVPILKDPKMNPAKKAALCLVHVDRLFPMGLAVLMKKGLEAKFKKPDGVISDAKSSVLVYGMEQAKAITDELIKAHALASMSTEDSRVGFYKRLSKMEYTIFYTNKSEDLDDTVLKDIVNYGIAGSGVTTHEVLMQKTRMTYWNQYWSVFPGTGNKEFLMFRDPKATTAIQSVYDLYMNRLYVSLGAFIAPMHKNSRHNKMFAARYAYYIIKGILNTFSLHGSMVGPYEKHSDPWMGYIFASRLEEYGTCLATERKSNGTLNAVHDLVDVAAVIPAFRYYRKLLLERAYPRPEYRIDRQPALNLIQLFFYVWAQPHCSRPSRKGLVNSVARNSYYFRRRIWMLGRKKATPCDIWNTTRRAY